MWAFAHSSGLRRRTAVRSRPRWGRRACRWASQRLFLQKFFSYANRLLQQLSGCLSQTILEVKMLDVEVLGWCGYTWSAVVRPVGCTAKFSETPLETAYGREMNIQFTGNSSTVDIPAVSMPIARSLKTCNICGIELCDKTHYSVAFYCVQPKAHLCNNHAV